MLMPAHHAGASHGVFGFLDLAAALVDDRQLGERERIVRFQFRHLAGVIQRRVNLAESLQHDGERRMREHVLRIGLEILPQFCHGLFELPGVLSPSA
jgi:hypothetical protein